MATLKPGPSFTLNILDDYSNKPITATEILNSNSNPLSDFTQWAIQQKLETKKIIEAEMAAKKAKEKEMLGEQKLTDPLRYDTGDDVSMRLHQTIIRYKGDPVVANWYDGLFLNLRILDKPPHSQSSWIKMIHSSNVDLDVSSPPLGYMNYNDVTFYVQRCPQRKQKQGFCPKAAMVFWETQPNAFTTSVEPYEIMWGKDLMNTIIGLYPSGLSILEQMNNGKVKSLAFSRKFALVMDEVGLIKLKHMTRSVGWFKPNSNDLVVPDMYMNPLFERELNKEGFHIV